MSPLHADVCDGILKHYLDLLECRRQTMKRHAIPMILEIAVSSVNTKIREGIDMH